MKQKIDDIYNLREKVREELVLDMRRCVEWVKHYMTDEYRRKDYDYEKGKHYGRKDDIYYYYILPEVVQFIYQNSLYRAKWIFFNDRFKCWFVYDEDKNEYVTFEALDTDTQIEIYRMLEEFLNDKDWWWVGFDR